MADEEKVVYELSIDLPGFARGETVQIPGLGEFENGSVYEVTKAEADAYRTYHTKQEHVHDKDGNIVGAEPVLGPTLLQAYSKTEGVEVSTVNGNQEQLPPEQKDEEQEEEAEQELDSQDEEGEV